MPPRKSNPRPNTVSTARFALKDDVTPAEPAPAPPAEPEAPAPVVVEVSTAQPALEKKQQQQQQQDREKPKDAEKKKKEDHEENITIEDLTLPKSIITRLAKGVLPPNTQIQANAILALSNSTTVFINYLAHYANENTTNAGKKTISPADVFKALDDTEFSFLRAPLEAEFSKFNAIQTEKRTSYRQKVRAKKADDADTSMADMSNADTTINSEASGPRAKKARVDPSAAAENVDDDAETEDEEPVDDDDDVGDEEDEDDEEEEDEDEEGHGHSGDDTQDALEEKEGVDEDEALDGDESD